MPTATFNGQVIAQSNDTVVVEGNHYFPRDSVKDEYLKYSDVKTNCPWKGEASYYDVVVGDKTAGHAAWYYPSTKDQAKNIEGMVAFWNGVTVSDN